MRIDACTPDAFVTFFSEIRLKLSKLPVLSAPKRGRRQSVSIPTILFKKLAIDKLGSLSQN